MNITTNPEFAFFPTQQLILDRLDQIACSARSLAEVQRPNVMAGEFMKAVRIRRWKFNCLVGNGKIKKIKKK